MRLGVVAALAFISVVGLSVAGDASASAKRHTVIATQGLGPALQQLARERGMQFVYRSEIVGERKTGGAVGELTFEEALTKLLEGTGLTYQFLGDKAITIVPLSSSTSRLEQLAPAIDASGYSSPSMANGQGIHALGSSSAGATDLWSRFRMAQTDQQQGSGGVQTTKSESSAVAQPSQLQEILVTARKRTEKSYDVPISLAVVGADEIDQRRLIGSADYLRGMAGVNQTSEAYGGQAIIIRRLETTTTFLNFGGGTTVGNYFGEAPITNSAGMLGSGIDVKLVDVQRVEVLRGPQGTAFGSSSMGGTVRIIPEPPKIGEFEGKFASGYSATSENGGDNYNLQAVGNIPLGPDNFAIRAVAYKFADSGYYTNLAGSDPTFQESFVIPWGVEEFATDVKEVGDIDTTGARLALLFRPTEALDVTLSYLTQQTEVDGFPIATSGLFEQTLTHVAPEHQLRGQAGGINDNEIDVLNATIDLDVNWADVILSYSDIEGESHHTFVASLVPGFAVPISFEGRSPHYEYAVEGRLVTKFDGAWNFLAGAYLNNQDDYYTFDWVWYGDPALNFFNPPDRDLLDYSDRRDLEEKSAFAEVSWDISSRLSATGGVRAYDYDRRAQIVQSGPALGGATVATDDQTEDSGTTFRANISFKPTDDSLVYASFSEGFRLGRPQPPVPAAACDQDGDGIIDGTDVSVDSTGAVASDGVESYEIGGKFASEGGRVALDGAIYYLDWTEVPVLIIAPCGFGYTTNAGAGRSKGIELQANFSLTDALTLNIGGTLNDAELTDDVPAQGFEDGDPLPGAPEESVNLGVQYVFNLGTFPAYVRADTIYVGEFWGDIAQSPNQRSGDYVKVNLSTRLEIGNLDFDLFVDNLTNDDAFTSHGFTGGPQYGNRMRPRTVGLQISYDF